MWLRCVHTFLLYLLLLPCAWAGSSVALLLSDNAPPFREFTQALTDTLQGRWQVGPLGNESNAKPPDLIVTAGSDAFRQALQRSERQPILATLISRQQYEKLLAEAGAGRARSSAIFLDQPVSRQLLLARQLLPGRSRVGILISDETRAQSGSLRNQITQAGFTLEIEENEHSETILPAASALLPRIDFLLALPDSKIFKRENIKPLLVTSYRYQRPIIAYSAALVNAGALAAIISTPADIGRQAGELILSNGNNLGPAEYPKRFSFQINRNVAEALNLNIPDDNQIRRAILSDKESR